MDEALSSEKPQHSLMQSGSNGDAMLGNGHTQLHHAFNVLLVDDTQDVAMMMGRLLEALGQNVQVAHSGQQALAAARRQRPDLIISDIAMPGMDGYELARQVRADPTLHDVMLVALTGYGQEDDRQRALAAGFASHLVKPISRAALDQVIASLEARQLTRVK